MTRLVFGDNNGFDATQDDDAPVTATFPDPVDVSGAEVGGPTDSRIVQERELLDLLQPPERGSVGGRNSELVKQCFTAAPEFLLHRYREPGTVSHCNN